MFESSSIQPSILDLILSIVLLNLFNSPVEFVIAVSISILISLYSVADIPPSSISPRAFDERR